MIQDLNNLNLKQFSSLSFLDKMATLTRYQEKHQFTAYPAWENVEAPYYLVHSDENEDIDVLGLLRNAQSIYMLSATNTGRSAIVELNGKNCLCITLSRNLVCNEEYKGLFNVIAEQNKTKCKELYLLKGDLKFIQAQMSLLY